MMSALKVWSVRITAARSLSNLRSLHPMISSLKMRYRLIALLTFWVSVYSASVRSGHVHGADEEPCRGLGTSILVEGERQMLYLCRGHQRRQSYRVSLGMAGLGKERVGDKKTPVGTYKLGAPRRSYSGFKTFIEIKVPRKIGVAVGIHGPTRWSRFFGPLNTLFNLTLGCIMMARDSDIEAVATFVRTYPHATIHIRE